MKKIKASEDLKVVLLNVAFLDALEAMKREHPKVIVIVIGVDAAAARKAVGLGALDVAPKTLNMDSDYMEDIHRMLDRAFCRLYARDKIFRTPTEDTEEASKARFHLVGESKSMIALNTEIGLVACDTIPMLITGETGTGKELVACLIHDESERAVAPFIAIDCGAVSETLLESELFGYGKGAFTGANPEGRLGRFRLADGGTLFLDEIGNMTTELQKKLLRVLQTQEIQPVNSDQTHKVDVRVITATNQPLAQMVADGKFREDLFYRLNGYEISLPPLRERKEDISLLVEHFLQQIRDKEDQPKSHVSEKVMELLEGYDWPGNVRELEHCIKRAAVNSQGEVILPKDLPQEIREIRLGESAPISEGAMQEMPASEISEILTYETLFDLPVAVFCQFISGADNLTETQITGWSESLSHDARRGANRAQDQIHAWTQAWEGGLRTSDDLRKDVKKVIKSAVTRLSEVRYGPDFERTAVTSISIKGRSLAGSRIAVLHEVVKEYGDDREKAASVLMMDPKTLDGWLDPERDVKCEASTKKPFCKLKPFPDEEVESLLTKSVDYFVTEHLSRAEWRAKSPAEKIGIVHLALKSVSGRLGGDHGCIYFGGMTLAQIEMQIYRRAAYLYSDEAEAIEALGVGQRTFRKYWSRLGLGEIFPKRYTLF